MRCFFLTKACNLEFGVLENFVCLVKHAKYKDYKEGKK